MKRKTSSIAAYFVVCIVLSLMSSCSQYLNDPIHRKLPKVDFRNGEHVMVKMKRGEEVPAVVTSSKRNKKYYVREYGKPQHSGKVRLKYIRAMEELEKEKYSHKIVSKAP